MDARKVSESRTVVARVMMPQDANVAGNVFGGTILKMVDEIAYVAATMHARANVVTASVDKIESFGIFVRFAGGRGLVPASETGTPRGADLRKAFKVGDTFQALVLAIDEQGRIRLSKSGAEEAAERKEAAEYMRSVAPRGSGKGFGTLGDLLRQKLEKK